MDSTSDINYEALIGRDFDIDTALQTLTAALVDVWSAAYRMSTCPHQCGRATHQGGGP